MEEGSELCQNGTQFIHHCFTLLSLHKWKVGFPLIQCYENCLTGANVHLLALCITLKCMTKVELGKQSLSHMLHPACSMSI